MARTALVYGTLRPGLGETVEVEGFQMFNLGWFPGVCRGDGKITCERIEILDDAHLAVLDGYEGYREEAPEVSLYIRERVGDDFIYVYNGEPPLDRLIKSGDWLEFTGDEKGQNCHLIEQKKEVV
jgi:gamma-glutamylcyclotransferase (GGCT)/AIG2-like uncharacterized protein YtfP